jgi:hypothetical protein
MSPDRVDLVDWTTSSVLTTCRSTAPGIQTRRPPCVFLQRLVKREQGVCMRGAVPDLSCERNHHGSRSCDSAVPPKGHAKSRRPSQRRALVPLCFPETGSAISFGSIAGAHSLSDGQQSQAATAGIETAMTTMSRPGDTGRLSW